MARSPIQKIMVLVDGTEASARAAEYAIELVRATPAELTAISVVDTATLRQLMTAHILVAQEMDEFEAELAASQKKQLDYVVQLARKARVPVETVLKTGVSHSAVLAEQKARNADLIVIGEFRSSFTKTDLVARERQLIVDEAPCPVLVVK